MFKERKDSECGKNLVNERKNEVAKTGEGPNMKDFISQDKNFGFYSSGCQARE